MKQYTPICNTVELIGGAAAVPLRVVQLMWVKNIVKKYIHMPSSVYKCLLEFTYIFEKKKNVPV